MALGGKNILVASFSPTTEDRAAIQVAGEVWCGVVVWREAGQINGAGFGWAPGGKADRFWQMDY